jgi:hypothetical protein
MSYDPNWYTARRPLCVDSMTNYGRRCAPYRYRLLLSILKGVTYPIGRGYYFLQVGRGKAFTARYDRSRNTQPGNNTTVRYREVEMGHKVTGWQAIIRQSLLHTTLRVGSEQCSCAAGVFSQEPPVAGASKGPRAGCMENTHRTCSGIAARVERAKRISPSIDTHTSQRSGRQSCPRDRAAPDHAPRASRALPAEPAVP